MAFEIFNNSDTGKFYFRLKATNGEIILQSEAYERKEGVTKGIASVRENAFLPMFEKKIAKNNKHYFVLKAKNHEIIGTSQMYESIQGVEKGINAVIENAKSDKVTDLSK